ncbi:MAG: PTS sugar transporter subunit IIA [bacterium]|nr:PTS sugar transporter subunit IIA [bacterium]
MSPVISYTDKKFVKELNVKDKFQAIDDLARVFDSSGVCSNIDALIKSLKEREEIMSTGIGVGIAIPHAKIECVKKMAFAIGVSKDGIDFDSMDGEPVHLVLLVAAGEKQHKEYLRLLANIMAILKKEDVKESIINSGSAEEIISIIEDQTK